MRGRRGSPGIEIGAKFGRLTVLAITGKKRRAFVYECLCECGNKKETIAYCLNSGLTQSCGCWQKQRCSETKTTHGASKNGVCTPEYNSWQHLIGRCTNPKNNNYRNYGGRGIKVCQQWLDSFEAFLADVGYRPTAKHSLDRIDVNGNYEPGNVRWATAIQQARNKTTNRLVTVDGVTRCITEWAELTGIQVSTIWARLKNDRLKDNVPNWLAKALPCS